MQTEKELVYREWVDRQRAYVAKVSGGRLGYVHIRDMSAQALEQLYLDLDSENQAREAWWWTFATITAASSTCMRSTCWRARAT